jgi:glycosyltransferase involved in cell wall biosynthesis
MRIERHPTPHQDTGRDGHRPRGIVVHTTVGSFESAAGWFADPGSEVSAHYLVGLDGRIAQFVDESDTAFHAGRVRNATSPLAEGGNPNLHTIGIEFEDGGDPLGVARGRPQYDAGARLLAGISARWGIPLHRHHVAGHRELFDAKECPGNLDLDRLIREARRVGGASRPHLACLLPARNAAADLTGWLESAGSFADAVVALDDGSSDATGEMLAASPLVEVLLRERPRDSYADWDDEANRNRLLDAAAYLRPHWVMFLDADERIPPDDARALRQLVERDAIPGFAYGFRVFRMIDGLRRYDRAELWVWRLFAWEPGQRVPPLRLHHVPVPGSIPAGRRLRTTVRIQHLASLDDRRRRARFEKYAQADPHREFQRDYRHLLHPPQQLHPWQPRPPDLPVLAIPNPHPGPLTDAPELDLEGPALSAIVIARDDHDRIERVVRSVAGQQCPEPFEVIVVVSGSTRTAAVVRERFPEVTLVELPEPVLPGAARNAGVRVARGEFCSFPGSHVELEPGSLAARLRSHRAGHPMVTGTLLNGTRTWAGWASYFLDHSTALPGRPSGPLPGPPDHCSYMRHHLLGVGGFPEDVRAGEDTLINRELWQRGLRAWRAREVRLWHRSPCRTPVRLMRHHFVRGRALGRIWWEDRVPPRRLARIMVRYLPRRLWRTTAHVRRWGEGLRWRYVVALPLVVAGAAAAWAGCAVVLVRRAASGGGEAALGGPPPTEWVDRGGDQGEPAPAHPPQAQPGPEWQPERGGAAAP